MPGPDKVSLDQILTVLQQLEQENNIRILFAAESGSRSWNFPSRDSDYDIRFLYVRPPNDYIVLSDKRDTIEYMPNKMIDAVGWDLKKALRLLTKSNPNLFNWSDSPIIYRSSPPFTKRFRELCGAAYSANTWFHHFLSLAKKKLAVFIDPAQTHVKHFMYLLRAVTACRYAEKGLGPIPTDFSKAIGRTGEAPTIVTATKELIEKKKEAREKDSLPIPKELSDYAQSEVGRLSHVEIAPVAKPLAEADLNDFFQAIVLDSRLEKNQRSELSP
jgi:uncharacterized protein